MVLIGYFFIPKATVDLNLQTKTCIAHDDISLWFLAMSHLSSRCSEFEPSTSRKVWMSHFNLLLAHFAPNLNFGKCLRRGNQMQGKSLVIYSKSNFIKFSIRK